MRRYEVRAITIYRIWDTEKQAYPNTYGFYEEENLQKALKTCSEMNKCDNSLKRMPAWDGIGRPPKNLSKWP